MNELSDFLASVEGRLRKRGMRIARRVELPDESTADLVGSRTYFSWKGLVLLSQHVIVRSAESGSRAEAERLFDTGFQYAKKVNRIPLLRGLQFGYMVIPCLVLNHADESLVRYAESRPRKHWALFEFPVVVDLGAGTVHYYRQPAIWGAFFFTDMREVVEDGISRALARASQGPFAPANEG